MATKYYNKSVGKYRENLMRNSWHLFNLLELMISMHVINYDCDACKYYISI